MSNVEQRENFIRSYERREHLKDRLKKETHIFKLLNEEMYAFLGSLATPEFEHANYRVAYRDHRKPRGGLTWEVVGESYLSFQRNHGRLHVDQAEKLAFIAFVKDDLRSKKREEVRVVDIVAKTTN